MKVDKKLNGDAWSFPIKNWMHSKSLFTPKILHKSQKDKKKTETIPIS
jgi:hypothetical protein